METSTAASDRRHRYFLALGWTAMVLVLLGVVVVLGLLTFSVRVTGQSMAPTLDDGDRVLADVLNRGAVRRFDLVEATAPDTGSPIVKRVVGLPGDQVQVRTADTGQQVLVRPGGSAETYQVSQVTWTGATDQQCCGEDGASSAVPTWTTVPDGSYWVIGDNWTGSTDSRAFGFVPAEAIGARLVLRVLPLGGFGRVEGPRLEPLRP